jgi:predicted phosphoribosyltransferase
MLDPDPEAEQPYRRSRWRGPCFRDRADAGRQLATVVARERASPDLVVALSRSSVPVARPVADELGVPLEVVTVRAIFPPGDATMPVGAVTEDGSCWIDQARAPRFTNAGAYLRRETARQRRIARAAAARRRGEGDGVDPEGCSVLVVAEGIDYPARVAAVVRQLRAAGAREVTVGAPVVAPDCSDAVRALVDGLYSVVEPALSVGLEQFYGALDGEAEVVGAPARRERALSR